MHVGINAQLLSYSPNYRNGGVSRYIRHLLIELARQPGNHQYTVFVNGQEVATRLGIQHPQITYISAPWPEAHPAARIVWEQTTLPALIRQKHIDILHSPVNILPERLPQSCAGVVTLHDLAFLRFPAVLTRSKRLYQRTFTLRSLRRAALIITVSESTKQDAYELTGIPLGRMRTVYTCINEHFSNVVSKKEVDAFRVQKELMDGFILYLGTLEPRKNLTTLISAYAQLRQRHSVKEKLVLAGGQGWLYDSIFEQVRQLGLEAKVLFVGFVADSEQALWYHAASVFAYPSLYEGFGLPVAEALACGTPTVTSNVSSLPEAGAQVALAVDPLDVDALTEALYQALTDQHFRDTCQGIAPTIAQRFSGKVMAEQTIAAYEQAWHTLRSRSQSISFAR